MVEIVPEEPKDKNADVGDNFVVLPPKDDDSNEKENNPDQTNPGKPTWPTKSGRTREKVEGDCNRALINSEAGKAAMRIPGLSIKTYWQQCVDDMQVRVRWFSQYMIYFICSITAISI